MTELRVRDLFSLSGVLGLMVGTMSFFMYIFANGMDVSNLDRALETGAIAGGVTTVVFLCYTSVRYVERNRKMAEAAVEIATPGAASDEGRAWRSSQPDSSKSSRSMSFAIATSRVSGAGPWESAGTATPPPTPTHKTWIFFSSPR